MIRNRKILKNLNKSKSIINANIFLEGWKKVKIESPIMNPVSQHIFKSLSFVVHQKQRHTNIIYNIKRTPKNIVRNHMFATTFGFDT